MQLLALALHELTTNALKHGALNGGGGRLNVTWQVLDRAGKPHLELSWVESGGAVDEQAAGSSRHGFGRELLEKAVPFELGATTRFELLNDGMRWWLDMPLREYEQREL
jgi:two-component sensor histidine kinase